MDILEKISELYGKIYKYNSLLLKKSEDLLLENKYDFDDIFDFYITSHALGYLKNLYFGNIQSAGFYLNIRCIIEGLAIKQLNAQGKISIEMKQLLQKQVFLIEYKNYFQFSDISDKILLPEKLQYDYDKAVEYYKEILHNRFDNKTILEICKSKIPFLCNPKISFHKIIENTLGEKATSIYGIYSSMIHSSNNIPYTMEELNNFAIAIFPYIVENFDVLPSGTSLKDELYLLASQIGNSLTQCFTDIGDILINVANVFEKKFNNNYVTNTFRKLSYVLSDFAIEKNIGLTEQIKSKWKILLEHFAVFNFQYFNAKHDENIYKLMDKHRILQEKRNLSIKFVLDDEYELYCKIYSTNHCEKATFDKAFLQPLGYLINEKGIVPKIVDLIKDFSKLFGADKLGEITAGKSMILDYVESQMISHANGYMWFANNGAWGDVNSVLINTLLSIKLILEKMQAVFKVHREIEGTKEYKTIINLLRNSLKKLDVNLKNLLEILSLPMIKKPY
nr:hypothetical protein [Clostridia bacterium]